MSEVVGIIESLVGTAQIRAVDGTLRAARVGEELLEGEVIITGAGAVVSIAVPGSPSIVLPGEREMLINGELALQGRDSADDASVAEAALDAVVAALQGDGDILEAVDAAAAGGGPGDEGSSFVRLSRIGFDQQDPDGIATGTGAAGDQSDAAGVNNDQLLLLNEDPDADNDIFSTDFESPVSGNLLINDSDPDGDPLSVTATTAPANGSLVVNTDGTFTYTPNAGFTGSDSFSYTISDGQGGTDTATVTIGVGVAPNSPPDAEDDSASTPFETPVSGNVLDNDSDPDGDALTVTGNSTPGNGTVVVNSDGTFTYTPNDDFSGDDSFTVTVTDSAGNSTTSTVTVSVGAEPNEPPVAVDDSLSTDFETPVSGNVLDNDSDPDGDPITVSGNTDPANGTVVVNADGTFTYTPNDDFSGDDTFSVTITDSDGATATSTVTVSVGVAPEVPNEAPDAVNDPFATDFETPVAGNVLANDSDPEGDELTVIANTDPANGSLVLNDNGTFTYTPNDDFSGEDSFTYTVTDSAGNTDTATVTVAVAAEPVTPPPPPPVNQPPNAVDDALGTDFGTPVSGNVLGNDADPEGDAISIAANTDPGNGSLTLNADGSFTYTPNAGFSGTDTFSYTITDSNGNTDSATVTLTVDGPAVFDIGDATVSEGGTATITITRSGDTDSAASVDVATLAVDAGTDSAESGDFVALGTTTVSFAAGQTSATITIATTQDTVFEGPESFRVGLSNPSANAVLGDDTGTVTILDDGTGPDPADDDTTSFSVDSVSVSEGGVMTFTVTRTGDAEATQTVDFATQLSGSASADDFTAVSGTLSFAPGEVSQTFTVQTTADDSFEGPETLSVVLSNSSAGSEIAVDTGTGTILDDSVPVVSLSGPTSVDEGAGTATFTISLSNPSAFPITVDFGTADGSAIAGSDYGQTLGTATFAPGETEVTVTVPITDDALDEADETFSLGLSNLQGEATLGAASVETTIVDDEAAPSFSIDDVSVDEGGVATITITRTGDAQAAQTVDVSTVAPGGGDTAQATDFTTNSATLTFASGVITQTFTVQTNADSVFEGPETFRAELSNATGGATISDDTGVVTIVDNDTPVISLSGPVAVSEASGTATYTISLSNPSEFPITVDFATANGSAASGSDYGETSGTATFAPGETTFTFTVPITDDALDEDDETFSVSLSGVEGQASLGTASIETTIIDDEGAPTFSISDATVDEGGVATITVTRSGDSEDTQTVDVATVVPGGADTAEADDFTSTSTTLTFATGVATQTFTVQTADDAVFEGPETFRAELSNATNGATIDDETGVVTIVDTDDTPVISLSGPIAVNEDAGTATYTISLSNASEFPVSVDFGTADGSAEAGSDYDATSGTATFAPGETEVTVTVPITNDALDEADETFTLSLSNVVGEATLGDDSLETTIVDDEAAPTFSIDDVTVDEGGVATVTITRTGDAQGDQTVDVATLLPGGSDTAESSDFTAGGTTLTFASGVTTQTFEIQTTQDAVFEGPETFRVGLSNATGGAVIDDDSGEVTIVDTDDIPVISLSGPIAVNEDAGTATYTISLSNPSDFPVSVDFGTADGSAEAGSDYDATSGTATFAPGATEVTVTVPITNDALDEADETFTLSLSNVVGEATLGDDSLETTIVDDEEAPSFSIDDVTVDEGGVATVTITRTGDAQATQSVDVATLVPGGADTAEADDFSANSTTLTFAQGVTTQTFQIQTTQDATFEGPETFRVGLSNATDGATISDDSGDVTIVDDEDVPVISVTGPATVDEGAGTATYTISLSNPSDFPITVDYATGDGSATAGSDYDATSGTATFAPGATEVTVTVPITDDVLDESDETFTLSLSGVEGEATLGTASVETTIVDNDGAPSFSIDDVSVSEGGVATITITRTGDAQAEQSVSVSTLVPGGADTAEADDFTPNATVLTFATGVTSLTFEVQTTDDAVFEGPETFRVALFNATNGATISDDSGTVTILDEEPPVINLSGPTSVNEDAGTATYTITLSKPSDSPISVDLATADGTATAGFDYEGTLGTGTFAPGETEIVVEIPINSDALDEDDETYTVTLSNVVGEATLGDDSLETTIIDDDPATAFAIDDVSVSEGGVATITISRSGDAQADQTVDVSTLVPGGTDTAETDDFSANSTTLTFAQGVTSLTFEVQTTQDAVFEGPETLRVGLSNATAGATIADDTGVVTILDDGTGPDPDGPEGPETPDDDTPVISLSGPTSVNEDAGTATYTISLSNPSDFPISVDYGSADGTATAGSDYDATAGTATFAPGETEVTVTVPITDDALDEDDETYTLTLSNVAGNATLGDDDSLETTIVDDDPAPSFAIDDVSVSEGGVATITITRSGDAQADQTVDVSTLVPTGVDTAEADDFSANSTTLTFASGVTSLTFAVQTTQDDVFEGPETFRVELANATGGATISDDTGVVTILDDGTGPDPDGPEGPETPDDDTPVISLSGPISVNEDAGTATYTISLSNPSDFPISVDYGSADGTAEAGSDYDATAGTASFAPGETEVTVTVPITDDALFEDDETYTLSLSNVQGEATLGDDDSLETTIVDDDPAPSFAIDDVSVSEGGVATITITRTGDAQASQSVDVATLVPAGADTAEANDFSANSTTLTFAAGVTSLTFEVQTTQDAVFEGPETFRVELSNATDGATISDDTGVVTILDDGTGPDPDGPDGPETPDDDTPEVSVSGPSTVDEDAGTATYTISLSNPSDFPITVSYGTADGTADAGDDYATTSGTVTFAPGETSKEVPVPIVDDTRFEDDETYTLSVAIVSGAATLGTDSLETTIIDNEPAPSFAINDMSVSEGKVVTLTVTRTGDAQDAQTVDITTLVPVAGTDTAEAGDFVPTSTTLSFAPGETTKVFSIATKQDAVYEGPETFRVGLSNATGGATISDNSGVVTILDDGTGPGPNPDDDTPEINVSGPVSVNETAGTATYTITLTNPSDFPVSVDYATADGSADAGLDYTAVSDTVTFAPGETSKTVQVTILQDTVFDPGETYTLDLSNVVGDATLGNASQETTIVDNTPPAFSINDMTVSEGNIVTLTVTRAGDAQANQSVSIGTLAPVAGTDSAEAGDFVTTNTVLTFAPGETTKQFSIATTEDAVYEGDETFRVRLSNATGGATIADNTGVVTILDDDAAVLSISGPATVDEDVATGIATYTITLSSPAEAAVSVTYGTADGSANQPGDYTQTSGTLTFAPGQQTKTVDVPIVDDADPENDETFTIGLTNPQGGATLNPGSSSVVTTIEDDDDATRLQLFAVVGDPDEPEYVLANTISEDLGSPSLETGTGTYVVLASVGGVPLATQPGGTVIVTVGAPGDSATRDVDYGAESGTITAVVGTEFTIDAIDDLLLENNPDEFFTLSLEDDSWSLESSFAPVQYSDVDVTTTIEDDVDRVYAAINVNSPINEGDTATFTVNLEDFQGNAVTVPAGGSVEVTLDWSGLAETASDVSPFPLPTTVTIDGGSGSVDVIVTALDDLLDEPNEPLTATITAVNDVGASFENVDIHNEEGSDTTVIVDDNDTVTLTLYAVVEGEQGEDTYVAANTINEDGGTGTYVVLASAGGVPLATQPGGTVTVNVGAGTDTATLDADYEGDSDATPATLSVTVGTEFTIDAIDDYLVENPDEAFTLSLEGGSWTPTVADDYEAVDYATATVTTTIEDQVGDDTPAGPEDTVYAVISVDDTAISEEESAVFTVSLVDSLGNPVTVPAGDTVTVTLAWSGDANTAGDVSASSAFPLPTSVAIAGGSNSVTVLAVDDAFAELAETLTATITAVSDDDGNFEAVAVGTDSAASTTITDEAQPGPEDTVTLTLYAVVDDGQGGTTYAAVETINEDGGTGTYVVLASIDGVPLATQPGGTVTVNVGAGGDTATRDVDYDADAMTITATVGTEFTIDAIDDYLVENPDEAFTLSLEGGSWTPTVADDYEAVDYATATVTTTIEDQVGDDTPAGPEDTVYAVISVDDTAISEEESAVFTVSLVDSLGNPVTVPAGDTVTVTLAWSGDANTAGDVSASSAFPLPTSVAIAGGSNSVTVLAVDDAFAELAETLTATITAVSDDDGNFEAVAVGTDSAASTTITDEAQPGPEDTVTLTLYAVVDDGQGGTTYAAVETINEDGGTGTYVVLASIDGVPLATQPGGTVTVNVGAGGDTATRDVDYDADAMTITATVGTEFTIDAIDDYLVENPDEVFTLSLEGGSWTPTVADDYEAVDYATATVTTTIEDQVGDDTPAGPEDTVYAVISVDDTAISEEESAVFTVSLVDSLGNPVTVPAGDTVTVTLAWSGDANTAGDVSASSAFPLPTSVAIAGGSNSVTVLAVDDAFAELAETLTATITAVSDDDGNFEAVAVGTDSAASTTITDEAQPGPEDTVTLTLYAVVDDGQGGTTYAAVETINEDGGTGTYVVLASIDGVPLATQPGGTVTVNVGAGGDTATRDVDYDADAMTITATVGTEFTIDAIDDYLVENPDEVFTLSLEGGSWTPTVADDYEAVDYATATVTTTIEDQVGDDTPAGPEDTVYAVISVDDTAISEEESAVFTVSLVDSLGNPVTVPAGDTVTVTLAWSGDANTAGDVSASSAFPLPTSVAIAGGSNSVTVLAVDDAFAELAETLTATITAVSDDDGNFEAVAVGTDSAASTTITDEAQPGPEDTVTLTLYAVVDDGQGGTTYVAANTINEDGGTGTYVVLASIDGVPLATQPGGTVTVNVGAGGDTATRDVDYDADAMTITATVGTEFTIDAIDDYLVENPDELFTLSLEGGSWTPTVADDYEAVDYATATVTTTIEDQVGDDTPAGPEDTVYAVISVDDTAISEEESAVFTVSLVDSLGNPVTVPAGDTVTVTLAWSGDANTAGDVSASSAFPLPTSVAIAGGSNSVTVLAVDDAFAELAETLTATITAVSDDDGNFEAVAVGTDSAASTTITDEAQPGPEDTVTLTLFAVVDDGQGGTTYVAANTINEDGGTGTYVVLASIDGVPLATQPGGTVTVNVGAGGDTATRDVDYDADAMTITATVGTEFTIDAIDDALMEDPDEFFTLSLEDGSWTPTVADDYEAVDYATATVTTTITDADFADADEDLTTPEDTDLSGNVLTNATPATTDDGPVLVTSFMVDGDATIYTPSATPITITSGTTVVGTLSLEANGDFTFDPALDYNGPVPQVTYSMSDDGGTTVGDTSTLDITVTPVNDPPVANDDPLSTNEDTVLTITTASILGNDTDVDGPAFASITITSLPASGKLFLDGVEITTLPAGGLDISIADLNANKLTFDPTPENSSTDVSFTYTVSDGLSDSNEATVTIDIIPVPDEPTLEIDSGVTVSLAATQLDKEFSITVGEVEGDDVITGGNIDYDEAEFVDIEFGPMFANQTISITLNATINGSWNYDALQSTGYHDDFWAVVVDGAPLARFFYNSQGLSSTGSEATASDNLLVGGDNFQFAAPSNANGNIDNFTHDTPDIEVTLDADGFARLTFRAATTQTSEFVTVNGVTTPANEYTYEIPVSAALLDTDSSETLSLTLTGVPEGDSFLSLTSDNGLTLTDNGGGNWTIEVPAGATSVTDVLTLKVLSLPNVDPQFNLQLAATATETENGATATEALEIAIDGTSTPVITTVTPISIDLDDDGVEYLSREAGVVFTDETTGESVNTAWVAPDDGLLVIDANQSGTVDEAKEYIFTEWSETAQTDMQAVKEVFDTNDNDMLDKGDEAWDQFAVWQDANSDGVTDEGEMVSLDDLGVESIALNYADDSAAATAADGDVIIHGKSAVTFTDGSQTTAEDTSFAIEAADLLSTDDDILLPAGDEGRSDAGSDNTAAPSTSAEPAVDGPSVADDMLALEAELMLNQNMDDKIDPSSAD